VSATTRRIREMSVVVEGEIPPGLTIAQYKALRAARAALHEPTRRRRLRLRLTLPRRRG